MPGLRNSIAIKLCQWYCENSRLDDLIDGNTRGEKSVLRYIAQYRPQE